MDLPDSGHRTDAERCSDSCLEWSWGRPQKYRAFSVVTCMIEKPQLPSSKGSSPYACAVHVCLPPQWGRIHYSVLLSSRWSSPQPSAN